MQKISRRIALELTAKGMAISCIPAFSFRMGEKKIRLDQVREEITGHFESLLDGSGSVHVRQWDSCFTEGHSYIHGMVMRGETRHRYRQWLTHKLGSWHRQYGRSGCVGCGRCIAWCPVGIDICEEVNAVLGDEYGV